jgi:hypothetical protein
LLRPPGIGIDVAEPDTYGHLDPAAIERAARRWLGSAERAWCAAQPCFRQAVVTVLSCKESVFKATGGSVPVQEVTVAMEGGGREGWARTTGNGPDTVTLWWDVGPGFILTVGIAGPVGPARRLLSRIVRGRGGAEAFCRASATPCHTPGRPFGRASRYCALVEP